MCLLAFCHINNHSIFKSLFVFQREESYNRPTLPLWYNFKDYDHKKYANVVGGADLQNPPGSWLAINTKTGDIAALTNVRHAKHLLNSNAIGRGHIVLDMVSLENEKDKALFVQELKSKFSLYNGYNLIYGSLKNCKFHYMTNSNIYLDKNSNHSTLIDSDDINVMSNSYLNDVSWYRTRKIKEIVLDVLATLNNEETTMEESQNHITSTLYEQLSDDSKISDLHLPNTGVDLEWERELAPIFVNFKKNAYGSRGCTIILVTHDNVVKIDERYILDNNIDNFFYHTFEFKINE